MMNIQTEAQAWRYLAKMVRQGKLRYICWAVDPYYVSLVRNNSFMYERETRLMISSAVEKFAEVMHARMFRTKMAERGRYSHNSGWWDTLPQSTANTRRARSAFCLRMAKVAKLEARA